MSVAKLSLAKIFRKTLDTHHSLWYNTHMTNDDLDHLCKMLQNSHDTASKVTGMDDTMFLQALDGIKWLRAKLKQYQRAEAAAAMDRLAQFDEENGLI